MSIETCAIRAEEARDHAAIAAVNEIAFGRPHEARLIRAIRVADGFDPRLSLVAEVEDDAGEFVGVGHILLSPCVIDLDGGGSGGGGEVEALALAPLAVHPDHQGKGIGGALIRAGLARAQELGHDIIIVLGEAALYSKFGFEDTADYGVRAPFDVPEGVFRLIRFRGNSVLAGVVRYPPSFDSV